MHQANVKQMKGQTTLGLHLELSPISEQVCWILMAITINSYIFRSSVQKLM